jgi:hypothetical protein
MHIIYKTITKPRQMITLTYAESLVLLDPKQSKRQMTNHDNKIEDLCILSSDFNRGLPAIYILLA